MVDLQRYINIFCHLRGSTKPLLHLDGPSAVCVCICLFGLSLGKSCSCMSLHMSLAMTTSGKYCPTLLAKKRSTSLGCVAICVFRLLHCSHSAPHSLQLNGILSHILLCALYSCDFCGSIYTQKYCHTLRTGGSD